MSAKLSTFDEARNQAQLIVTCLLTGDRDQAGDEWDGMNDAQILACALVLADLVAYVHCRWANAVGINVHRAWQELMADVAQWLEERE